MKLSHEQEYSRAFKDIAQNSKKDLNWTNNICNILFYYIFSGINVFLASIFLVVIYIKYRISAIFISI